MNHRIRLLHRSSPNRTEPFLKFLKPGALAQMRDSRISARSQRFISYSQIRTSPPSSPHSTPGQPQVNAIDGVPCFSPRIFGPRCPQRKKFMAAKCIIFSSQGPSSHASDAPDPIIDVFSHDILAAH